MGNHLFLWLRNRTTDNRKCEKARNIKEKHTIEMFNTVSRLHVAHRSSPSEKESIVEVRKSMSTVIFLKSSISNGKKEILLKSICVRS